MNPRPNEVKVLDSYKLHIVFQNGEIGVFDCNYLLQDNFYKSLQDISVFKTAKVVGHTIEWANGVDICPDELYENSIL